MSELGNIQPENDEETSFDTPQNYDFIRNNNKDEKKLAMKEYYKNYYQKNKEKIREYNRNSYLKRKNEKENSQNDNYMNKSKSPIECNENVHVNEKERNTEGTSFINQQTDDCGNNLSDSIACPYGQPNIQSADGLHSQPLDDHDALIHQSLLEDSDFLDYLNSILNS